MIKEKTRILRYDIGSLRELTQEYYLFSFSRDLVSKICESPQAGERSGPADRTPLNAL